MKAVAAIVILVLTATLADGQWLRIPTRGIPRTPSGAPDLNAPVPRTPQGRPIITGLWRPTARVIGDISLGLQPGETIPIRPWADSLFKERIGNFAQDDPSASCIVGGVPRSDFVPYPFKILEQPEMMVILYEAIQSFRQIFTDGRALPKDPSPAWMGYSIGRWEGDAFVVESNGFNDNVWLDNAGRPATSQLKVTERFVRRSFGRMDIIVTIDDPKAYTRPWTVTQPLEFQADNELIEYICNENNKYFELVPQAAPGSSRQAAPGRSGQAAPGRSGRSGQN